MHTVPSHLNNQASANAATHRKVVLQRQCACGKHAGNSGECEECKKKRELQLHRSAVNGVPIHHVPSSVHQVLGYPGQPLDLAMRAFMEPRFGHDFSGVRIHNGAVASQSARDINALAFTTGQNIVFSEGQYAPDTKSGQHLLAHELAHVIQQNKSRSRGGVQSKATLSTQNDPDEQEANAAADRVMDGGEARLSSIPGGLLQRQEASGERSHTSASRANATTPQANPAPIVNIIFGHNAQTFDAILDRQHCLLTLRKKIKFNFLDNPPGNIWGAGYVPWPNGKAEQFTRDFIRVVTKRWSNKYPLEPTAPCAAETCKTVRAAVQVVPVQSGEHTTMDVGYRTGEFAARKASVGAFSAHLSQTDVESQQTGGFQQVPAEHEFGHMLGRPHINAAHCGPDQNAPACYGTNASQMENIMGKGSEVSVEDYAPFVHAIGLFNQCTWQAKKPEGGLPWWAYLLIGLTGVGLIGLGIAALAGAL